MAWLETTKNGYFQIVFWIDGERYKRGLGTQDERLAHAQKLRLDENVLLLKRGRLLLPEDADICTFLLSDGQLNGKKTRSPKRKHRTLKQFSEAFLASIPEGLLKRVPSME